MNALISIPSKTSRIIAQELGLPVYFKRHSVPELENAIRWGSTRSLIVSGVELNKAEAIKLASNKAETRRVLAEQHIPVPVASEDDFPLIGRTTRHSQGRGFFFISNEYELLEAKRRGASYFSQYYPKQNEYRVHVGSGRCLLMSIKEGDKTRRIWNKRKSGFTFRHLRRSVWLEDDHLRNMVRTARTAVKALGLDFGAVDIMADAGEGYAPFVISEVNTSPALSPLAVKKYCKYFATQLNLPYETD